MAPVGWAGRRQCVSPLVASLGDGLSWDAKFAKFGIGTLSEGIEYTGRHGAANVGHVDGWLLVYRVACWKDVK